MDYMTVTIRAVNKDGYVKDILVFDQVQDRMSDMRVRDTVNGHSIIFADFPEAERLDIIVRRH